MIFFTASGTSVFLAVSDWISSITEIACQSTERKAIFFLLFPVRSTGRNIWFHASFANCCGGSRKPIWLHKIDEWEKKHCWVCVCCFWKLCTWDFGTLGINNDSLSQHYSKNAEVSFNPQATCSSKHVNLRFTVLLLATLNNSKKRNTAKLS